MIGVAVVGCGYWGPNLLRNFSAQKGCWVKFVADVVIDVFFGAAFATSLGDQATSLVGTLVANCFGVVLGIIAAIVFGLIGGLVYALILQQQARSKRTA